MELTDTQKMQVRLLKLGALLIVLLLALFIYLSVKIPDTSEKLADENETIIKN